MGFGGSICEDSADQPTLTGTANHHRTYRTCYEVLIISFITKSADVRNVVLEVGG
jgi:hypothetical protein